MTNTRTFTIQVYNKLSSLSKVSHVFDTTSKVMLGVSRGALGFFEVKSDTVYVSLPDSTVDKIVYKRAFRLHHNFSVTSF